MKYNGELYAKLDNGKIINLYYDNDKQYPRNFYKEGRKWFIDHDVSTDTMMIYCHSEIVEFVNERK